MMDLYPLMANIDYLTSIEICLDNGQLNFIGHRQNLDPIVITTKISIHPDDYNLTLIESITTHDLKRIFADHINSTPDVHSLGLYQI